MQSSSARKCTAGAEAAPARQDDQVPGVRLGGPGAGPGRQPGRANVRRGLPPGLPGVKQEGTSFMSGKDVRGPP